MRIIRDTVHSQIGGDCSEKELNDILKLLTFSRRNGDLTHITEDGSFYTGLISLLEERGMKFEIEDVAPTPKVPVREIEVDPCILENRVLRKYQIAAVRKALAHGRGVIQSPTGSGKTEMAAASIAHFRRRRTIDTTFMLCPTVFLMQQMANKFEEFGFEKVGRVGGGKKFKKGCKTVIYVVDSAINDLDKGGPSAEFIKNADMMGLEEAHHAKATRWTDVAHSARARVRLAFTATVHENPTQWSYEDLVLLGVTGPIIFNVRSKELRLLGHLADPLITTLRVRWKISGFEWHRVYKQGIVYNDRRNSMMISIATSTYEAGFKSMIFVGEKKHGHLLAECCAKMGCEAVFVHGGGRSWVYHPSGVRDFNYWRVEDIAEYVNSREQCILVTTQVLDEGLDVPVINVLIMGTGMKKYRRTIQRIGRGMRPKEGQNRVFVFDFWDESHDMLLGQSEYRRWTYSTEEYDFAEDLQETQETMGCKIKLDQNLFKTVLKYL